MNKSFLLCTREILTEEQSNSWINRQIIEGSVAGVKTENAKIESEIKIKNFMNSLINFREDLRNISKLNKIKVVLFVDEVQVFVFFTSLSKSMIKHFFLRN